MHCSNCKAKVNPGDKKCPNCGATLIWKNKNTKEKVKDKNRAKEKTPQERPISILLVSLLGGVFLLFLLSSIFATDNPLFGVSICLTVFTPIFFIISLVLLLINKRENKRRTNYFIISTAVLAVLLIISPVITYLTKETLGEGTTAKGKIAFDSDRDENREIYIMNITGTEQTRLTDNPADDGNPCFSP